MGPYNREGLKREKYMIVLYRYIFIAVNRDFTVLQHGYKSTISKTLNTPKGLL